MADRSVFKQRHYVCRVCSSRRDQLAWNYDTFECCAMPMSETYSRSGDSAAVHGDEIDEVCAHGICNADGTPRRFRSKTEKRAALESQGLCIVGDTPKPSGVRWV